MGWAKYYEDNMSIYNGRLEMRNTIPVLRNVQEKQSLKKAVLDENEGDLFSVSVRHIEKQIGRRGLELVFRQGIEEKMIRKLQMNGWWWSKVKACWCNLDTEVNRQYAESLIRKGASVSAVT